VLNWAFSFGAAKALLSPAGTIASVYQQQVIGRLGLAGTLLTFTAFRCGIMIPRGARPIGSVASESTSAALNQATPGVYLKFSGSQRSFSETSHVRELRLSMLNADDTGSPVTSPRCPRMPPGGGRRCG
jgi:hypothetical protein